jgi:hypothetical protein
VAAADLDGDGKRDLAVANQNSDDVSVLLNEGGARLAEARRHAVGVSPFQVVARDLDGDGKPDLAVANPGSSDGVSSTVSVLLNKGDGAFRKAASYEVDLFAFSVDAGDFDRDGDPDLAVASSTTGTLSVLENRGNGRFGKPAEYRVGGGASFVEAADLNGDRRPDLAVADVEADSVSVLLNRGDGAFRRPSEFPAGATRSR